MNESMLEFMLCYVDVAFWCCTVTCANIFIQRLYRLPELCETARSPQKIAAISFGPSGPQIVCGLNRVTAEGGWCLLRFRPFIASTSIVPTQSSFSKRITETVANEAPAPAPAPVAAPAPAPAPAAAVSSAPTRTTPKRVLKLRQAALYKRLGATGKSLVGENR